MDSASQTARFITVLYADIFDFPLTPEEAVRRQIRISSLGKTITRQSSSVRSLREKNGYLYLDGREALIHEREKRRRWSQEKEKWARTVAGMLKFVPGVRLIGLSGAVSSGNATKDDDIDLFIITAAGWLWTTRFLVTILLDFLTWRRKPGEKNIRDKICLNMFVDTMHLSTPQLERDLYGANEVMLVQVLWQSGDTYQSFLAANNWAHTFLPNAFPEMERNTGGREKNRKTGMNLLEPLFRSLQIRYMGKRPTNEVIEEGRIRFHPRDARVFVLDAMDKRLRRFRLLR